MPMNPESPAKPGQWVAYKAMEKAAHWTIVCDGHTLFTCWRGEADARRVCELHNGPGPDIASEKKEPIPPSFAAWLSERIGWLKREWEAGGDHEHLNTRRKEAITIADKFGVEWMKK